MRALVVDPDPRHAETLVTALSQLGYTTSLAASVESALDTHAIAPDVMLCEHSLPDGSGIEILESFGDRGPRPRTVFFTKEPGHDESRRAFRAGAVDFLSKPVHSAELGRLLQRSSGFGEATTALDLRSTTSDEEIANAIRALLALALVNGATPATRARLGGAVHEILENVALHAYDGRRGPFHLSASCTANEIRVHVTDEGTGFDTVRARLEDPPAALPIVESEPGGLARATALVEGLRVTSSDEGTCVSVRVSLHRIAFDADGPTDLSDHDYLDPHAAKRVLRAIVRGQSKDLYNIPPCIAVSIGRLLAGPTPIQLAQATLWS